MSVYDAGLVCTHRSSIKFVHFVQSGPPIVSMPKNYTHESHNFEDTGGFRIKMAIISIRNVHIPKACLRQKKAKK